MIWSVTHIKHIWNIYKNLLNSWFLVSYWHPLFNDISVNTDHLMEYKYLTISDQPYKQLYDLTKEDCRNACGADSNCKHAEYNFKERTCALGNVSCADAKKTKQVRSNTDFILIAECPLGKTSIWLTSFSEYCFMLYK